jgi:hypothetical protein
MCMAASCVGDCTTTTTISVGRDLYTGGMFREVGPSNRCRWR